MTYHVPALLNECIEGLNIQPSGIYVDVTFGGGGHSRRILEVLGDGRLIAFDQDDAAEKNKPVDNRFLFLSQNFRFLRSNLRYSGVERIDGLLADLGVSFHQFDEAERGFSFRFDADLDMRMNNSGGNTAADIINAYEKIELIRILRDYGELKGPGRIASSIIHAREKGKIKTTAELLEILDGFAPRGKENKFYAKVFQALRIEVNREIEFLKEMLIQAGEILNPGGRFVVITYHSIEDRIVKNFFRSGNFTGEEVKDFYGNTSSPFRLINRKVIVPGEEEIANNNRARSARLRVAEKI
jgi:16S rRNA (cytosine1402-N4)-methyltransferase